LLWPSASARELASLSVAVRRVCGVTSGAFVGVVLGPLSVSEVLVPEVLDGRVAVPELLSSPVVVGWLEPASSRTNAAYWWPWMISFSAS